MQHSLEPTVHLFIPNEHEIYQIYSSPRNPQIRGEILSYLEDQAALIPLKVPLTVEIEMALPNGAFIQHFQTVLKGNLAEAIQKAAQELRQQLKIVLLLMLAGLIVFLVLSWVVKLTPRFALNELLVIAAWVFVWRAVEIYFFDRRKLKRQKLKWMQLYLAQFKFSPSKKR